MSAAKQDSSLSAMSEIMSRAQAVGPECYHQNCQQQIQQNLSSFAYDDQLLLKDSYLWHQYRDSADLLKGGDLSHHGIHPKCRDQDHQPLWNQLYFQLEEAKHLLDRREKLDACRAGDKQDVNALQAHLKSLLCTLSDSIKRIQPYSSSNQLLTSTPVLVGDGTSGTDAGLIESSDGISTPLKFISHPNTQPSSSSPLLSSSMPPPVSQYLGSSGCSRDTDAFLLKHLSHPSQCPSSRESHKSQLGLCPLVHLTELLSLSQQASFGSVDSQRSASSSAESSSGTTSVQAVLSTAASSVEDGEMMHKHADSSNLLELSVLIASLSLPFILYLCSQISDFLLRQQASKAVSASRTLRPSEQETNHTLSVNPGLSNTDGGCGQDWLHSSQARELGHCLNFGGAYSEASAPQQPPYSEASAPQQPPPAVVTTSVVNKEEGSLIRRLVAQFSTCNTTKPAAITRLLCKPSAGKPTATAGACLVPGAAAVVAPASDLEDDDDTTLYVHLKNNSPRPVRLNAELQTITMIAGGDDDVVHQNRDNDQAASKVMTSKASLHQGYEGPPSKSEHSTSHHVSEMTASGTAALMMSPVLQFHGTLVTSFSPAAPPVAEMPLISTISSSVPAAWSITSRSSDAAAPSFSTQHQLHQQHGEQDHCPVVMGNSIGRSRSSTNSETGCQQQVLLPACDQYPSAVEDVVLGATNNTYQQQVEPYLLATSSSLVSKLRAAVVTSSTLCEAAKTQVELVGNTFFAQPYPPRRNLSPDYSSARSLKVLQTAAGFSTADCQGQACPDDSEIVLMQQKDLTNRRLLPALPLADKTIFQELHHYSATDGEDASGADGDEDASGSLALALQDSCGKGHSALPLQQQTPQPAAGVDCLAEGAIMSTSHLHSHTSTADDYCYGSSALRSSLGIRETLRELDSKHHEEQLRSLEQVSSDHGSTLEALVRSYKSQLSHLAAQLCAEQQCSRDLRIQLQELHGDIRMGDAMIATLCMTASNSSSAHDGVVLHELQHV